MCAWTSVTYTCVHPISTWDNVSFILWQIFLALFSATLECHTSYVFYMHNVFTCYCYCCREEQLRKTTDELTSKLKELSSVVEQKVLFNDTRMYCKCYSMILVCSASTVGCSMTLICIAITESKANHLYLFQNSAVYDNILFHLKTMSF